jgi:hypothetical protein
MMDTLNKRHKYFIWTEEAEKSFNILKEKCGHRGRTRVQHYKSAPKKP